MKGSGVKRGAYSAPSPAWTSFWNLGLVGLKNYTFVRQVLLGIRAENSNLAKSLSEKSNHAMYQDEKKQMLAILAKLTKLTIFLLFWWPQYVKLILSDYKDSYGIPVYSRSCLWFFCQSVEKYLHFLHIEVTPIIKGNQIFGQFDSVASCVYNFESGTSHTTRTTEFSPLPHEW